MKAYIIWIEGLNYKTGEKIHKINDNNVSYTKLMGWAMRVLPKDKEKMKKLLVKCGVAHMADFIPTSYIPAGTLFKPQE